MRPIVTDRVAWSVGRSVPIEMFGLCDGMGRGKHVLAGDPEVPRHVAMTTIFWLSIYTMSQKRVPP